MRTPLAEMNETASPPSNKHRRTIVYLYTDADTKRLGVRDSQDDELVVVEFDEDGKARVDQETGAFIADRVDGLRVEEETRTSDDTEE